MHSLLNRKGVYKCYQFKWGLWNWPIRRVLFLSQVSSIPTDPMFLDFLSKVFPLWATGSRRRIQVRQTRVVRHHPWHSLPSSWPTGGRVFHLLRWIPPVCCGGLGFTLLSVNICPDASYTGGLWGTSWERMIYAKALSVLPRPSWNPVIQNEF